MPLKKNQYSITYTLNKNKNYKRIREVVQLNVRIFQNSVSKHICFVIFWSLLIIAAHRPGGADAYHSSKVYTDPRQVVCQQKGCFLVLNLQ